jgi:bud emergence protein 1
MKVKIYFGDDLIAIRVPTDVQLDQLYEKIRERLKIPQQEALSLKYRDESSGKPLPLTDNEQLDVALRDNDKLVLYVDYN